MRIAAGLFGASDDPDAARLEDAEEWVGPETTRSLRRGMLGARVVGRSMEPGIPSGAWCLFAGPVTGARSGRVALAKHRKIADAETGGSCTVERYPRDGPSGAGEEGSACDIRLVPANRELPDIVIASEAAEEVRGVAEMVEVLGGDPGEGGR